MADGWWNPAKTQQPGQLYLTYRPKIPATYASKAGPGEIEYQGEQIAALLPGFNDYCPKIWRPIAHLTKITLIAKPLPGWEPNQDELDDWVANCQSLPVVVEWALKN
jgi:hypothetical protein